MAYATRPFSERFNELGDAAEAAFERFAKANGIKYEPIGFRRPNIPRFWEVPVFIRQMPDFICHGTRKFFVECKGSGGKVVKVKDESLDTLKQWHEHLSTWVFIYDSNNDRYAFVPFQVFEERSRPCRIRYFDNSATRPYHEVPAGSFDWFDMPKEVVDADTPTDGRPRPLQGATRSTNLGSGLLSSALQRFRRPTNRSVRSVRGHEGRRDLFRGGHL